MGFFGNQNRERKRNDPDLSLTMFLGSLVGIVYRSQSSDSSIMIIIFLAFGILINKLDRDKGTDFMAFSLGIISGYLGTEATINFLEKTVFTP